MGLRPALDIALPAHAGPGGFDHAAVDGGRALLFVAHTANDAVDVIDLRAGRHVRSVTGLAGVAGALVDEASGMVFTSNRGEDSVGFFRADGDGGVVKVPAGIRPNGLAYDPDRALLLAANVGDPGVPGSPSVTLVDVRARAALATIPMPGRTRWAVFDPDQRRFFVNIADPSVIVAVDPAAPAGIARVLEVPARGPHGLDLDRARRRLYCACDAGRLVSLDSATGKSLAALELSGAPDVVFLHAALSRLYVAIGDPGVIDVVDVASWRRLEVVATEPGAHTLALDAGKNRVIAFLPAAHGARVFEEGDPAA